MADKNLATENLEPEVQRLARTLFQKAAENKPTLFETKDLLGRMIEWSLEDESLRVALFRFVDVLPSLDSSAEIGRHLEEYFARVDHALGGLVLLAQALRAGTLIAPVVRRNVVKLARRFIAEESGDHLIKAITGLRKEPAAFTLDAVGEATVSDSEAAAMQQRYLDLLRRLSLATERWLGCAQIDQSDNGNVPRVNLSVKLSSLCARFDPLDPGTEATVRRRLRELLREAAHVKATITVDMEQYAFKELTLEIFQGVLAESEFRDRPHAAIALQAYLRDSEKDVRALITWARKYGRRVGVRLVKGAYWDSEIAWAQQKGWPIPVYLEKAETDAAYERLSRILLEARDVIEAAFGSHNLRSLAHAITTAKRLGIPTNGYEIQMLYGMAEPVRRAIIANGQRVRVYLPVGELLPGISYLIRRLMENTSNTSFLRQTYADRKDINRLIQPPTMTEAASRRGATRAPSASDVRREFRNEPLIDFSRDENRERFGHSLQKVREEFSGRASERINGETLESLNPANPAEIIGRVQISTTSDVEKAIEKGARYFPGWRARAAAERANFLFTAAELMRQRRWELAAWEVFEVGKSWREADADVAEAIDYLEYYGREMLRLASPRETQSLQSESNVYLYEPRGLAAIIAPWNFPLAILTGMTAAALVTGNCALVKPAEQSPIMAVHLLEIFHDAGMPADACQLLQGGGEIGAHLVRSPRIHLIAFTGSREVGLEILQQAYTHRAGEDHVKRVICEMGGKNAVIVDSDADLDEAIVHIIDSAFGYQGQKCSAASRLILVEEIYQRFLARLIEATKSLQIGSPEDPRNTVGPLIDVEAKARVLQYIQVGKTEASCALEMTAPSEGFFVGPVIFRDVHPQSRIAQEEIFGPVLAVIKAADFDDALAIANQSLFALTGGIFSRSPAHIEKARREFRVGNLYINRSITGAVVERQPFGGLKLSGIGSKAGGPDYLLQFLEPRTISENTLRHGFVPPGSSKH
ncbi:MAG TPA: proline dehydrogenase family protein [Candidatus Binatia bacterium]|jgi:RHH-type proline utilization regulon transcriptional repressor/proline dehydrogenase/delta 1-pyrroline-5-carboxylate dehydrogenase